MSFSLSSTVRVPGLGRFRFVAISSKSEFVTLPLECTWQRLYDFWLSRGTKGWAVILEESPGAKDARLPFLAQALKRLLGIYYSEN